MQPVSETPLVIAPRRIMPNRFFAVPDQARRDRRPTDITMLVTSIVVVAVLATRVSNPVGRFERALSDLAAALPEFLDPVWAIGADTVKVWAAILVVVAFAAKRGGLLRDLAVGAVLSFGAGMGVGRLVNGSWPDISNGLFSSRPAVDFPILGFALGVSVISIGSSHLTRPYRYLCRWIIGFGAISTFALGANTPSGVAGAVFLGLGVAALVHVAFGSPGGLPSFAHVRAALEGIDVTATVHDVARQNGVVRVRATGDDGTDLDVKVYGRDAWDGQLIVSLWKFIWYRDGGPTLSLTRLQQVEHEAFLTLLAERRGAHVLPVLAAGADAAGDALLVTERLGTSLTELSAPPPDLAPAMWVSLDALHRAGVTHGAVDLDRIFVHEGVVRFADLSAGATTSSPEALLVDRAQMLAVAAVAVGPEAAVRSAYEALGEAGLGEVTSYLQPAAMSPRLRRSLSDANVDIDDVRSAAVAACGGEAQSLIRLRRLTIGRLLMAALLTFAFYTLLSGLLEIGLDTLVDAVRDASLPIVVAAFFISLLSRPVNALALSALAPIKVPLGRLTMLMFAMNFVNVAMPSTAGRVAVNIRFFQRSGVEPTTAVAVGALDGFIGFLCQMILTFSIVIFGLGTLDFSLDQLLESSPDWLGGLFIVVLVVLVILAVVVSRVPRLRRPVVAAFHSAKKFVVELVRSPQRLVKALSANMTAELIYSVVLFTVLAAFSQDVVFVDIVFVGIAVSLFSGLMPVPGGIGVTEAGLTAGFIASGVEAPIAFAAALTVRLITFYLPPLIGWFALRWLQKRRYL
ncbi:MAG: lysylphosphatidylglycerol synthase domain-containing protein [Ilumatobacteraceae bacterium]